MNRVLIIALFITGLGGSAEAQVARDGITTTSTVADVTKAGRPVFEAGKSETPSEAFLVPSVSGDPPPSEPGRAAVEYAAGLGTLVLWRIVLAVLISGSQDERGNIGRESALAFLFWDAVVSIFGVTGVVYGIAESSPHYESRVGATLLGTALLYAVTTLLNYFVVSNGASDEVAIGLGIVGLILIPLGAVVGANSSKTPVVKNNRDDRARPFVDLGPNGGGVRAAPTFTIFGGTF